MHTVALPPWRCRTSFFYTKPLACELSGLPVVNGQEEDDIKRSNKQRRHRTSSKKKHRSETINERRKKDSTSAFPKENSVFYNEELKMTTASNTQSEERGSTTTNTSSGVNTTAQKESPLFLPSPVAFPSKMPSRTNATLDDSGDFMFPSSRRQSSNLNEPRRVRRSESTREVRNWSEKDRFKLLDDR